MPNRSMLASLFFDFVLSFLLVCIFIQQILVISHKKHLFDEPTEHRKIHLVRTPNLGGVAVVAALFLSCCFFLSTPSIPQLNFIIFSCLLLFLTGLTDDLVSVSAQKKIVVQTTVALILCLAAECRFDGFNGLFGIESLPLLPSVILSTVFIVTLINAFNLIDGINYLAGSIGVLVSIVFGFYFYTMQLYDFVFIALSLAGSLSGFLFFNRTPARIFLGDSGSTFLGLVMAIFSICFVNGTIDAAAVRSNVASGSAIVLVLAIVIIPLFDTLRIFSLRLIKGRNPFSADRQHIHHRLLDAGFSHFQSTCILLFVNAIVLVLAITLQQFPGEMVLLLIIFFTAGLNWMLSLYTRAVISKGKRYNNKEQTTPGTGQLKILVKGRTVLK